VTTSRCVFGGGDGISRGRHAIVLKRSIATDLLAAVEQVQAGQRYVSPALNGDFVTWLS
jgi:DNA-binding NarL/FixJ family response regulator